MARCTSRLVITCVGIALAQASSPVAAQTLESRLAREGAEQLVQAARESGDARRGAVVFYQPHLQCTRCHVSDQSNERLGPDLTKLPDDATDEHLVESVLQPSKAIRQGFEPVTLTTVDGRSFTGIAAGESEAKVAIRDAGRNFKLVEFDREEIDEIRRGDVSIMPTGQVNALTSRQQFLDLVRYLIEIREGGSRRARELEPAPSLYAARPLPPYESRIDHAGMLSDLDDEAFRRGEKIYNRLCINCHGTHDQPGSLPTSLRFATGRFKNGKDPHTMYETLTRGFGMMAAQTWMVPRQKYDVIHYIRQAYLKDHNPSQYFAVDSDYLAGLPAGDTRGPEPSDILPWEQMDYGPNLVMTLEIGDDGRNFAYKGNAIRLDAGPGGVSQGGYWMVFDYDTMRVAAAWSGKGFCDWNGINFNGRHNIHPRVVGELHVVNPTGPGWGRPEDGAFDDVRLVGRDKRRYGPLPRQWSHYKGMYYHGPHTIVEYTVGGTRVLELPGVVTGSVSPVFTRTLNLGPRDHDLVLQVAHRDDSSPRLRVVGSAALFGNLDSEKAAGEEPLVERRRFADGARLKVGDTRGLNINDGDFTVTARIKTSKNGTILAQTEDSLEWHPNGLTWFVRNRRLHVDIGWVGVFRGETIVADGRWHDVAMTYSGETGRIRLYVDGRPETRQGTLRRKAALHDPVVRIGFTATNFPSPSQFDGEVADVRYYNALLDDDRIAADARSESVPREDLVAHWNPADEPGPVVTDQVGGKHDATWILGGRETAASNAGTVTVAGIAGSGGEGQGPRWSAEGGDLRLRVPAGTDPLNFTLWFASADDARAAEALSREVVIDDPRRDLTALTRGGPSRWPQELRTEALLGEGKGPFAVDVLQRPVDNPWFCQLRLTGFDFLPDGDRMVVSAWDGSIWLVAGLKGLAAERTGSGDGEGRRAEITWRRIASGLFQPLGVKVVDGKIYVTCRDQICVLHDLNGDEEIDYFENFNNDHQVTDHFHEFAMGLQVDEQGNFYYAKSARHALPALVPHHGTLLRVSKDGSRTDILANGFRAANGVCLNPDGTFIVTDQEGHWNPKNRINYVREGGFYGNMFGYHDVTDSSDDAMEQPLCWITNEFDRSPAELLWVDSPRWGPLNGRLLNLSYGYGQVYVVPHERVDGLWQGGMCALPIDRFPTGVMRGRFHPVDGQLYLCGMFAWAGNQTQPGGLYRLRYTGRPVHLPVELNATENGMTIGFSGTLDESSAADPDNYSVRIWNLKRTSNYGSRHYDERSIEVAKAVPLADGRSVRLEIPDIAPTWCMEVRYRIKSAEGDTVDGRIHNTIHRLSKRDSP